MAFDTAGVAEKPVRYKRCVRIGTEVGHKYSYIKINILISKLVAIIVGVSDRFDEVTFSA